MMPCKVFISYSHDSQEHKDRVLELADRLREDGIDCTIDQYEESPIEGWQRWMVNQIEEATFVLVACTEQYDRRFCGCEEVGTGKGVTWEGGVIIQELYDNQGQNAKFIPIALMTGDAEFIPSLLRSVTNYRLNMADGYELLCRRLTNQPRTLKPELGIISQLPPRDRKQFFLPEDRQLSLKKEFLNASKSLLSWKRTLGNNNQITRPELAQLTDRIEIEASSTTIVLGVPGCGKSALMATLGHWVVAENYVLLAIKADYLNNTVNTLEDLQQDIHLSWNIRDAIRAIASTDKVILLIDQLDAVAEMLDRQPGRLNVLLSLIQFLAETKNVHIVATCREFEFRHGTQFTRLESFERLDLQVPEWSYIAPLLETEQHNPNSMGEALRELLRIPLHLDIFLQVAKPGEIFKSSSKLLDKLWTKYILDKSEAYQSIEFLTQLAERMTKEEVLWLPSAIADENPKVCRALEQAGILMMNSDNSTLGFRHQTFYDHTLARSFARGSQSLVNIVLERQDGIFIRPMLLRSLNYLRDTVPQEYQRQLQALFNNVKHQIRSHIRTLLIEFVGVQPNPDSVETRLLISLLNSETEAVRVLNAMTGSPGWFRKLRDRNEFRLWLEKEPEQAVYCCPLLTRAASFASEEVWELLERYWLDEQAYDSLSIRVILNIGQWTHERLALIEQVIQRSNIEWNTVVLITEWVSDFSPDAPVKLIRAYLEHRLEEATVESLALIAKSAPHEDLQKQSAWYCHDFRDPYRNLLINDSCFYGMEKFAQLNPKDFFTSIFPWLVSILTKLDDENDLDWTVYRECCSVRLDYDRSIIISTLKIALQNFSQQEDSAFLEFASRNLKSELLIVHRLLVHGLERIAEKNSRFILDYLMGDQRRLSLGDPISNHHFETKRLITLICPYLSCDEIVSLENFIGNFNYYFNIKKYKPDCQRKALKDNRRHRLQLLLALPDEYLSAKTKMLKQEEMRAFPEEPSEDRYPPHLGTATCVGGRMNEDEMSRASDQDLLNLFDELSDETKLDTSTRVRYGDLSRSGDVRQQAEVFGKLVQKDPDRFLKLLPKLQPCRHEHYVGEALFHLSETDFPGQQIIHLVEELNQRGFSSQTFQEYVARALRNIAQENGLPQTILNLLESWLSAHHHPELASYWGDLDSHTNTKLSILFEPRGSYTLPGGRGNIMEAIAAGYLDQHPPDLCNWAKFIRESLDVEPHPVIWVDILRHMPPLLNDNRLEATELFDQVIQNSPKVLEYFMTLYTIARYLRWFEPKETVQNWLDMIQANQSVFSHQAYGELLLLQYWVNGDNWSLQRIREHLSTNNSEAILCGLAHAANHLWKNRKCRLIATEILDTLLSCASDTTMQEVIGSFLNINRDVSNVDPEMRKLIQKICKDERILIFVALDLVERVELDQLADVDPELVVEICQSLINLGVEIAKPQYSMLMVADHLTTIAIQLHRQTDYREIGLEIFERLLAFDLRATRTALETLDRKPNRSEPFDLMPKRGTRSRKQYR